MKKFEYKKVDYVIFSNADLNAYGKDGWELISVVKTSPSGSIVDFYFKREMT